MGCRVSQQEHLKRRMATTKELGWQRQYPPSIAPIAVMGRLDYAYRNAALKSNRSSMRSGMSLLGFSQPTSQSPSLVRVSFASSVSVKVMEVNEVSDDELSSGSSATSRNRTSIYSSSLGENRPRSKRPLVTYYEHSPCSESTMISVPSLSQNSYSSSLDRNEEEYGPWAPGFL